MFEIFEFAEDLKKHGGLMLLTLGLVLIFISGIFFAFVYYAMDQTEASLQSTDCVINDNSLVSTCQELWAMSFYPFLALKEILIWLSYFFIFALVTGMLLVGYQSGTSPIKIGFMIGFVAILTYAGIEISNVYRTLLENTVFRNMMIDFTVYNKVMTNFPWFCFFVGIFSVMLGMVNYQRAAVNTSQREELNF